MIMCVASQASRRFSPITHRPITQPMMFTARALSTYLPPHPAYIDFRVLMERTNETATNPYPNNYMPITYKEWPNGMDEDLYDVVSYMKLLQLRYAAVGECVHELTRLWFPRVLVSALDGASHFAARSLDLNVVSQI